MLFFQKILRTYEMNEPLDQKRILNFVIQTLVVKELTSH